MRSRLRVYVRQWQFILTVLAVVCSGTLALAQSPGQISGTVVDPSGGAVPSAAVVLSGNGVSERRLTADANGAFMFGDVAPGLYVIHADAPQFAGADAAVRLEAGAGSAQLTLVLQVPGMQEAVTITATRGALTVADAPASVTVLDKADLEERNVSRIGDALKGVVGIHMRGNLFGDLIPGSGNQSISMRGLPRASRNLVMIDGNPVNSVRTGGVNFGVFDMDNAERVEVVRGAFSSLYGGNALGGVINLITPTPTKREVTYRLGYGFGGLVQDQESIGYADKLPRGFALNVGATRINNRSYIGDYVVKSAATGAPGPAVSGATATTTVTGNPGWIVGDKGKRPFEQVDYHAKLFYDITPSTQASAGYAYNRYDTGYTPFTTNLRLADGTPAYAGVVSIGGQRVSLAEGDFLTATPSYEVTHRSFARLAHTFGPGHTLRLDFNRQQSQFEFTNALTTGRLNDGAGENNVQPAARNDFGAQYSRVLGTRHVLVAGGNYTTGNGRSRRFGTRSWRETDSVVDTRYESYGESRLIGLFIQDEVLLTSQLRAFIGGRYDKWTTTGTVDQYVTPLYSKVYPERSDSQFSPKLSMVYRPSRSTSIRSSWGTAFRAPTLSELYAASIGIVGPNTSIVESDPNLAPERVNAWEVGADQRLPFGTILKGTYFDSRLEDMVYRKTIIANVLAQQANAGRARARGVELEAHHPLTANIRVFVTGTINRSRITANEANPAIVGNFVTEVPDVLWSAGLDGRRGGWLGSAILRHTGRSFGASDDVNAGVAQQVPGAYDKYTVLDLNIARRLWKGMTLDVGLNNVTNQQYYQIYKMPGTTAIVQLKGSL